MTDNGKGAEQMNVDRVINAAAGVATHKRTGWALESLRFAEDYAEPGYSKPEAGIVFGDWNTVHDYDRASNQFINADETMPRVGAILERMGFELEWEDEWAICDNCYRAVRTSPDSYSWQAAYWQDECEIVCAECVLKDPTDYLEAIANCPDRAVTLDIDLSKYGWQPYNGRYENGLHPGQDDTPREIVEELAEAGIDRYIFQISGVGQFDVSFRVWVPA